MDRKPLSDDEIMKLWSKFISSDHEYGIKDFARAIEQAHGIGVK